MLNRITKYVDGCIMSVGTIYGLDQIETILGIVILSIQIIWLLYKFVRTVIKKIKNKRPLSEMEEVVKDTVEGFENVIDKIDDLENK